MFKILFVAALLGVTVAFPPELEHHEIHELHEHHEHHDHHELHGHDEPHVTRMANQVNEDGTYGYEYELSNGVAVQESGVGGQYATGGFRHISPEGEEIQLAYTADENGFHPQGSHLPTPPPIPEEILKAIEFIQNHPTPEEQLDRQHRLQHNQ